MSRLPAPDAAAPAPGLVLGVAAGGGPDCAIVAANIGDSLGGAIGGGAIGGGAIGGGAIGGGAIGGGLLIGATPGAP